VTGLPAGARVGPLAQLLLEAPELVEGTLGKRAVQSAAAALIGQNASAFLDGYAQAAAGAGLFASLESAQDLLRLFEIEKALYELRYELDNRPAWAGIPLYGLHTLAEG